ncbi:hypothetical protein U1Q18_002592 [Sarracenia purpurea var. burkii]
MKTRKLNEGKTTSIFDAQLIYREIDDEDGGWDIDAAHSENHVRNQKVQELVDYVRKTSVDDGGGGVAVDIGPAAFRTSLNLLSNTIFLVDLANRNEDSMKEFRDLVWSIMVEEGKSKLVDYFPELATIDPQSMRRRMMEHFGKVLQLFGKLIDNRLELRRLRQRRGDSESE